MTRMTTILATLTMLGLPGVLQAQDPAAVARGAGVWANNCVRCHNARPSTERTDAQWTVIVSHMRARANLTREQGRVVTAFLQATNLPEGEVPRVTAEPSRVAPDGSPVGEAQPDEPVVKGAASDAALEIDPDVLARLLAYVTSLRQR